MNPFRLALSLLRIPRLFISLILFPLLFSLILVYCQLVLTNIVLERLNRAPSERIADFKKQDENLSRRLVYGDGKPLPELLTCKWVYATASDGTRYEHPPNDECAPSRLDVAVQIPNLSTEQIGRYQRMLNGNVERLHLCETCHPDIIIREVNGKIATDIHSVWGLLIVGLVTFDRDAAHYYIQSLSQTESILKSIGERYLHIRGFTEPVSMHRIQTHAIVVMNIAGIFIIALWLALKAHRRVLDYFARSGALLPMVAATGKRGFYLAIWLLTLLRVSAFLLAALPLTVSTLNSLLETESVITIFGGNFTLVVIWALATLLGLTFATLVASIAELKQRHNIFSFLYRYVPILVCCSGALLWLGTFIMEGEQYEMLRSAITALPVIGIGPVLVAPILKPKIVVLTSHALLTLVLLIFALHHNANWFAAHLEDL